MLKVDRYCPRCHLNLLHFVERIIRGRKVEISCAHCGHQWRGIIRKNEVADSELAALRPVRCKECGLELEPWEKERCVAHCELPEA